MFDPILGTPWVSALVVLLFALLAFTALRMPARRRSARQRKAQMARAQDPKAQLDQFEKVQFERFPLLNKDEARVFELIQAEVATLSPDYRVMAQISLAEVLGPDPDHGTRENREIARRAIADKRIDFGVFDQGHNLRVAIQSQRAGYGAKRPPPKDPVMEAALRKAGVPLMGVKPGAHPAQVATVLARYIRPAPL
ncbi:MAG: DUF2726 domain-containing protein, partial [Pseudomonadota bacterium]